VRNGWTHEQLLAALSEAMKARQAVPSGSSSQARTHNIGAELAQLTYSGRWGPSAR
jgi:hypothetical protein